MCSISGFLASAPTSPEALTSIARRMNRALRHRGPDGSGALVGTADALRLTNWSAAGELRWERSVEGVRPSTTFVLAQTRLSIRDLEAGHQPMLDPTGRVAITFNGEIYNADELAASLRSQGFTLRTQSDTEVLLLGYVAWGRRVLDRLRGMFAFAIWDGRDGSYLLARDRLGIKPLHYAETPNGLVFASELKGLLASGLVERRVRRDSIRRYLRHLYVPAPEGPLEQVRSLEPGQFLEVRDGVQRVARYWELTFDRPEHGSLKHHVERFHHELERSVKEHLVSDVPVAAFLSGGLDSSAITALMRPLTRDLATYTVGFDDPRYDESRDAQLVADHLGTKHHRVHVTLPELAAATEKVLRHFDQPFADSSAVPTYLLAQATARDVKVVLAGDGSDELLAGYRRARDYAMLEGLRRSPRVARRALGVLAERAAPMLGARGRRASNLAEFVDAIDGDEADSMTAYLHLRRAFRGAWEERLLSPEMRDAHGLDPDRHVREVAARSGARDPVTRLLHVELATYLPYDILQKVDLATMAHGLEARVPFLDHELVEIAANMPLWAKLLPNEQKVVLRRAMAPLLPRRTLTRRKQGFHLPVSEWFRAEGRAMAHDLLLDETARARGYFERDAVEAILAEHLAGRDHGSKLWALLQLEFWHRTWVDVDPYANEVV
jgi:asparagine synthase (glutamine-hydrolysing)